MSVWGARNLRLGSENVLRGDIVDEMQLSIGCEKSVYLPVLTSGKKKKTHGFTGQKIKKTSSADGQSDRDFSCRTIALLDNHIMLNRPGTNTLSTISVSLN